MPYANLQSESVQRRIAEENLKAERKRKLEEREAFWAEYKRRLALRDERKAEMARIMGYSTVLAGTMLRRAPTADYGDLSFNTRISRRSFGGSPRDPAKKRGRPTNLSQKRRIVKQGKGR